MLQIGRLFKSFGKFILPLLATTAFAQSSVDSETKEPLLLEWSAVEPRVEYLAERSNVFTQLPFNGTVTVFVADDGTEMVWNLWGDRQFALDDFNRNQQALRALAVRDSSFHILARINMPTELYDWRDETRWLRALENLKVLARLAAIGKFDGIMLDTEQYDRQVFNPDSYPQFGSESGKVANDLMQRRGRELVEAIESEFSPKLWLLTFGFHAAQDDIGDGRDGVKYTWLAPLLDGLVEHADATSRIIDGWEYSYGYKEEEKFKTAVEKFITAISGNSKRERVELGLGLWLDYAPKRYIWNVESPHENYFSPQSFCDTVRMAFDYSDGVVWIYSQRPNWWTGEQMPKDYTKELKAVLNP